jgi:ComF family protein
MPLNLCPACGSESAGGTRHQCCHDDSSLNALVSPYHYANPLLRGLIKDYKYHGAVDIEKILAALAMAGTRALKTRFPPTAAVVAMPLHDARERRRGFNQADCLARAVAASLGLAVIKPLARIRRTGEQASLSPEERQNNCRQAFRCAPVSGNIILVDDVVTSGETMEAAAETIKIAGASSVTGFALAHGAGDQLLNKKTD